MVLNYLIVAVFAFVGGNLRYVAGFLFPKIGVFPIGTLVVNLVGCFLFSWLVKHIMTDREWSGRLILGVGTGFCGALTTFSSFSLDAAQLINGSYYFEASLYLLLSICGGLLMAFLGEYVYQPRRMPE